MNRVIESAVSDLIESDYVILPERIVYELLGKERFVFADNIAIYRDGMRSFFLQKENVKYKYYVSTLLDDKYKCHQCGYWPKSSFKDENNQPLCVEFYNSRDYFQSTKSDIIHSYRYRENNITNIHSLPCASAYNISRYLVDNITTPFIRGYAEMTETNVPDYTFQLQCTYYSEESQLDIHTDKGYFEGIVGPADGLMIINSSGKEIINLGFGEIILYTGRHFQYTYTPMIESRYNPNPLQHGVIASMGRMSVPFACLNYKT